jgi:lysophospholipase L1-like esterase
MKTHPQKPLLLAALFFALTLAHTTLFAAGDPSRWGKAMAAFEEQDRTNPPKPNGVLFLGSSSIRLWKTLAEDFPGVPLLNRGFGGSQISDSIYYFDKLVMPSKPRLVVFFAGGNDINSGVTAEQVAADFRELCAKLHKALPETHAIFISLPFVESRWKHRAETALANTYISAFCHSDPRLAYVDMNSTILSPEGTVRPEYYRNDKLHMNEAGYAVWTKLLRPLVK